jgi:hypothetical protein
MKRYKVIKIPTEAWENFNKKKLKMEDTIKEVTKAPKIHIQFTNFMKFMSQKPTRYVYPDELVNYFTKKKTKKMGGFLV